MSSDNKKILLIGSSGYLGSHLRNELSSHHLFCTSTTGKDNSIQLNLLDKRTYTNVKLKERFDCIFILSSTLKGIGTAELKREFIELDALGLAEFLQFVGDNDLTDKIIYTSSMTVYGVNNALPVKEDGELNPLSSYGLSKLIGEKVFEFYCRMNNVNGVILRIPGIYGGSRKSGYIFNTALNCLKNDPIILNSSSLGYWETINVNDLSKYVKDFMENYDWHSKVNIFNISYGVLTDFRECANYIKELLNSTSTISTEGTKGYVDFYLDNSKVKQYINIDNDFKRSLESYIKTIRI